MISAVKFIELELAAHGLLLCELKAVTDLPESVWLKSYSKNVEDHRQEQDVASPALAAQYFKSGSLLLVGHAGKEFWKVFSENQAGEAMQKPDPVDSYSAEITEQVIEKHLPNTLKKKLFPATDCPVNLMALGHAFNWHSPSPLGMGIHEEYGLWSAYRAVWWLDLELANSKPKIGNPSPKTNVTKPNSVRELSKICAQCKTQECVTACPATAIDYNKNPDLGHCADYRLMDVSQCESTCLSRMACPYATEHRYTESQMSYHYDLTRSAIAKYRQQSH